METGLFIVHLLEYEIMILGPLNPYEKAPIPSFDYDKFPISPLDRGCCDYREYSTLTVSARPL